MDCSLHDCQRKRTRPELTLSRACPPAPVYRATLETPKMDEDELDLESQGQEKSLNALLRRLLTPHEAGLYHTHQVLASLGWALDLPGVVDERANIEKNDCPGA